MNPETGSLAHLETDFPRASGDEPMLAETEDYGIPFSPREWG